MIRMDAVKAHLDEQETMFFARQLESIEPEVYRILYPELKYRDMVPVSNRDNPGAETITYRMYDMVGIVKVISNYADDLPRVDVFGKEYHADVKGIGGAFGYNRQEIRAAIMAGIDLDGERAATLRMATRQKENRICWDGDAETGILGVLNNVNVPTQAVPTGVGGYTWALKTADEIINDIRIGTSLIRTQSKDIHRADTMLLPIDQYDIIAGLPRSTHSDVTVLQFILDNAKAYGLTTIDTLPIELELAFVGATADGAIIYKRDPGVLEQRIPLELQLLPVQVRNLEFIVNGEARNAGVVIRRPLAMCFLTGI